MPYLTKENFGEVCDDAVSKLLSGEVSKFSDAFSRLENFKVGSIRSLLNAE